MDKGPWICVCGLTPCTGLDCGVSLAKPPRRTPAPKSPEQLAAIRAAAWKTRRERYGKEGHS